MSQTVKERFVSRVLTSTSSTDDNGFVKYYIVRDTMPFPVSHVFLDSTVVDEKKYETGPKCLEKQHMIYIYSRSTKYLC